MKISDLHEALGWALLHFLWQGAAIAVVYTLVVLCVRRSARGRYASGIVALAVMGIVFGITFARHVNAASASRDAAARLAAASSRPPSPLVLPDRPEPSSLLAATGPAPSAPVPLMLPLPSPQDREVARRPIPQTIGAGQASTEPAKPAPIAAAADVPAWSRPLQSVLPWIVSAWGLGVILLLIRFALGWRSVRRMKSSGEPPRDPLLLQRFAALCERLRISRPVRLLVSPTVGVPALVGWLKPVVIIPAALLAGLTPAQTDAILAHELGHVRRHDFLINALQCLLEIVLFYHPAVWWISAQVRREREHCCDDIAAACCGSAADYARALAALEEWRGAAAPALSLAASGGSLVGRIRRLVSRRETAPELPVWPLSLVAGALLLVVLPLAWLQAGEKTPEQPDKTADSSTAKPKVEKKQLAQGAYHGMDASLLRLWGRLEGPDVQIIPESRVATLREAIGKFIAGIDDSPYSLTPEQTAKLKELQTRDSTLPSHTTEALQRHLAEVFAIHGEPIQMAFNVTPSPGTIQPREELERMPFGPPAENGLRAAAVLAAAEPLLGSNVMLTISLWNSGAETILAGIGTDTPGLYPALTLRARGRGGREIALTPGSAGPGLQKVRFTRTWQLRPGETAVVFGYSLRIGQGTPVADNPLPDYFTAWDMPGAESLEEISLDVSFPYPHPPGAAVPWPEMRCGPVKIRGIAAADVKVWLATGAGGTWPLEDGVTLKTGFIGLNGPNTASYAILTWPAADGRPERAAQIDIAADMFGNRERWGMAWDVGQKVIWIAVGKVNRQTQAGFQANELKRMDYSDPENIDVRFFDGWPAEGGPSAECVAKLNALLAAPAGKETYRQTLKAGPPDELPSVKFNRAIRTGSTAAPAAVPPGLLLHSGIPDTAVAAARGTSGDELRSLFQKGQNEFDHGRFDEAKKAFSQVLAMDPYNTAARRQLEIVARKLSVGDVQAAPDNIHETQDMGPSATQLNEESRLKLAIAAADGFFRAADAAGKMKFLRLDDAARTAAEAHFQKHGARAEDKARVILSRVQDDGSVVLAYDIGSRSHFFRAMEQNGVMLLDWENSTLCQQGVYHIAETERPKEPFRILAVSRTDDYYNHGFSDQTRWSCEALRFPGVEGLLYSYIERTAPEFQMLQERHQKGLSTTLAFTVKFPAEGKENQVEILKVEPVTGAVNATGKAAPAYHGQKEILNAGTHVLSPRITVKVTQDMDEGTLRNELVVEGTDDAGTKITDRAALPYGTQTWALLIEEPATPDGSCIVSIGSRWGVRRFAFASEKTRALGDKPGFYSESRWYATEREFSTETLRQFANAAVVDWWYTSVRHMLKVETPRDTPALEVRLICEDVDIAASKGPEIPEMIRPDSRLGASSLPRFINLGPMLLGAEDLASGGSYIIGSTKHLTRIRDRSLPLFRKLCQQYYGRQAAVVNNGVVLGSFKLENGVNSFSTYSSLTGLSASEGSGGLQFKPAPAGSTAHAITVQSPAGKPLPAFRVIAGVRSSVSSDFEKKHNCSVVNWQSHMLREGKDGKIEWSLSERSYDEMVLRIEADGYVPQVTGWLKKADGPQEITVQLAPDPGIRGSVQTHGGGRWAHDATVVLGMIRKDIRIKGATFPELDLGPEPKTLRDKWDRPLVITPDNEGRFALPTEIDPTAVVLILHGDGVYLKPYAEWKEEPHVQLERWGRINGHVQWGPRVGKGEKVDLGISLGDDWGWPDIISQRDTETANEDGIFVFQRLLPNVTAQLSSPMTFKDDEGKEQTAYESSRITHVKTQPLAVSAMLGGVGRTVTGKLKGRASWDGVTFHLHPNAPHIGFPGDDVMWQAWSALQKSADGPLFFRSGLKVAADGSFRIEGMLPGHYQIFFSGPEGKDQIGGTQFQVPAEEFPGQELEPFHAGEITVK